MHLNAQFDGQSQFGDLVDAAAIPALAVIGAIEAMGKVVAAGADIQREERKKEIFKFVSGILFFVPFVTPLSRLFPFP